jgi:hypothetical protein
MPTNFAAQLIALYSPVVLPALLSIDHIVIIDSWVHVDWRLYVSTSGLLSPARLIACGRPSDVLTKEQFTTAECLLG